MASQLAAGNTLKFRGTPKTLATKPRAVTSPVAHGKTLGYGYNARDATMGNPEPSLSPKGREEGATTVREWGFSLSVQQRERAPNIQSSPV